MGGLRFRRRRLSKSFPWGSPPDDRRVNAAVLQHLAPRYFTFAWEIFHLAKKRRLGSQRRLRPLRMSGKLLKSPVGDLAGAPILIVSNTICTKRSHKTGDDPWYHIISMISVTINLKPEIRPWLHVYFESKQKNPTPPSRPLAPMACSKNSDTSSISSGETAGKSKI